MGLKETIQSILERLRTVTVTDRDGNSVALYAAVFNDQIAREAQGQGYVFPRPACFVETILGQGLPIGQGATGYDVTFRFHLVQADYNTEGMFDEALPIFDLRDAVHRKVNIFKPDNCSHLFQSATNMDYSHDNTVVCILDYASHFVDLRGTVYDTESGEYIEQTLTDPVLEMGVTAYLGALPEDEDGTPSTITGSISSGDGVGPTVWRDGSGVPADSLGYNGDYYLDDDTGDVYKKVDGVYELRANIKGADGTGGAGAGFTNVAITTSYKPNTGELVFIDENALSEEILLDLSGLSHEGSEIWIINRNKVYKVQYTGQPVYDAFGQPVALSYYNSNVYLRYVGGSLRLMIG